MFTETTGTRKSFIAWIGGKSRLADRIIPIVPRHTCYCEVFAGAAWLLFKKPESKVEIINDINLDLITLYRVVKHHLREFIRYLEWLLVSREEFARFRAMNPDAMTDVQRAVRFYYLVKNSYSGAIDRPRFSTATLGKSAFNLLRVEEDLSAAHIRLARVYVENLPYSTVIERFDRAHTFFYVDPPYYGCEGYYGEGIFSREDFARLRELLGAIKGSFCLSINDVPEVRKLFAGFEIRRVPTRYHVGQAKGKKVHELLITNYRPEDIQAAWPTT